MSQTEAQPETPKHRSSHRRKDSHDKKSSKKRKRELQNDASVEEPLPRPSREYSLVSPSKKQRTERHPNGSASLSGSRSASKAHNNVSAPSSSPASISPFLTITSSLYLSLSPIAHLSPLESLCAEHISPLLLSYYPPLKGVILSFSNPRLSEHPIGGRQQEQQRISGEQVLAKSVDEYAVSYIWLVADFVVLRPDRGVGMEGWVNVCSESHIGLVCWNLFNASIPRAKIPVEWQWKSGTGESPSGSRAGSFVNQGYREESEGYWADAQGRKVEGSLEFTVADFEAAPSSAGSRGFLSIEGTLVPEEGQHEAQHSMTGAATTTKITERELNGVADVPVEVGATADGPTRSDHGQVEARKTKMEKRKAKRKETRS